MAAAHVLGMLETVVVVVSLVLVLGCVRGCAPCRYDVFARVRSHFLCLRP